MQLKKCTCKDKLMPSVVAIKHLTEDFMSPDGFGEYIFYYCQCDICKKKSKEFRSSLEAIEAWNKAV